MATWQELSRDNFQAATKLLNEGHLRSSVSRAYYAAYCAVTAELVGQGVQFAHGWNNPAHDQLPELILNTMRLPRSLRFPLTGQFGACVPPEKMLIIGLTRQLTARTLSAFCAIPVLSGAS